MNIVGIVHCQLRIDWSDKDGRLILTHIQHIYLSDFMEQYNIIRTFPKGYEHAANL